MLTSTSLRKACLVYRFSFLVFLKQLKNPTVHFSQLLGS